MHELLLLAQETPDAGGTAYLIAGLILTNLAALFASWLQYRGKQAEAQRAHELNMERLRIEAQRDKLSEAIADADEHGQAGHVVRALENKLTPIERSELAEVKRKTTERRAGLGNAGA